MTDKDLKFFFKELFDPLGFKKKNNRWNLENDEIIKIIELQKSRFGNYYYVNFGIKINALIYMEDGMHIFNGLGSLNIKESEEIRNSLNFDFKMEDQQRKIILKHYINEKIIKYFNSIYTEDDAKKSLTKLNLLSLPLVVKKHFQID